MNSSNGFKVIFFFVVCALNAPYLLAQDSEQPTSPSIFKALDLDGNGILSSDEIENATKSLKSLDKNLDGRLERHETFSSPSSRPNDSKSNVEQTSENGQVDLHVGRLVERFFYGDVNEDGLLSRDEIPEKVRDHLLTGDVNRDGAIDRIELERILELRLGGGASETESRNANSSEPKSNAATARQENVQDGKKEIPGHPLTIRIFDDIDSLMIKGNAADVAALKAAFQKANLEFLRNDKSPSDQ